MVHDQQQQIYSFPPILPDAPRILILGTMPGRDSLKYQQYYAYRQNHFWPMMYRLLGVDIDPWSVPYEHRVALLMARGIALWDVFESCIRPGTSSDSMISREEPNKIIELLQSQPGIAALFFNGGRAEKGFKDYLRGNGIPADSPDLRSVRRIRLPSSSPIPTASCRNIEEKIVYWEAIMPFIRPSHEQ